MLQYELDIKTKLKKKTPKSYKLFLELCVKYTQLSS